MHFHITFKTFKNPVWTYVDKIISFLHDSDIGIISINDGTIIL